MFYFLRTKINSLRTLMKYIKIKPLLKVVCTWRRLHIYLLLFKKYKTGIYGIERT